MCTTDEKYLLGTTNFEAVVCPQSRLPFATNWAKSAGLCMWLPKGCSNTKLPSPWVTVLLNDATLLLHDEIIYHKPAEDETVKPFFSLRLNICFVLLFTNFPLHLFLRSLSMSFSIIQMFNLFLCFASLTCFLWTMLFSALGIIWTIHLSFGEGSYISPLKQNSWEMASNLRSSPAQRPYPLSNIHIFHEATEIEWKMTCSFSNLSWHPARCWLASTPGWAG